MEVERQLPFVNIVRDYKELYLKTDFITEGHWSLLDKQVWLCPTLTDLILNCLDQKATLIRVEIRNGCLIVEDDVFHEDVEAILSNINSDRPVSTSKRLTGGVGIQHIRTVLEDHDGNLEYRAENGRIIAVVTWEE